MIYKSFFFQSKMNTKELIGLASKSIRSKKPSEFLKWLNLMPIQSLKSDMADNLLHYFLDMARQVQNKEIVPIILREWSANYPPANKFPLTSYLFTQPIFGIDLLGFIFHQLSTITYTEIMLDLIDYDSLPVVSLACKRVDLIFGPQTLDLYNILLEKSKNNRVSLYLEDKVKENASYQNTPKWMEESNKSMSQLIGELPPETIIFDQEKLVNSLLKGLEEENINIDDINKAKEIIERRIAISTKKERELLMTDVNRANENETIQDDLELLRILGPVNPLLGSEPDELRWGGARMFISSIFNYDDETDSISDYFTGSCLECNLKIANRYHCLRQPRPTGGWLGCYCSWNCIREYLKKNEEANILLETMIKVYEDQMNIYHVYDRIDDVPFNQLQELEYD